MSHTKPIAARQRPSLACNDLGWNASSRTLVDSEDSSPDDFEGSCNLLERLPAKVLDTIIAHLDLVSLVCLRSTNRHFYTSTFVDRTTLNNCVKWRVATLFMKDIANCPTIVACGFCKNEDHRQRFGDDDLHFVYETPTVPRSFVRTVWKYRFKEWGPGHLFYWQSSKEARCYAHLMEQFGSNQAIEALLPSIVIHWEPVWLQVIVVRCMHCGRCVAESDTRLEGCLECLCDVCPRIADRQYVRTGPRHTPHPQPQKICQDRRGLYVIEVGSELFNPKIEGRKLILCRKEANHNGDTSQQHKQRSSRPASYILRKQPEKYT